MWNDYSEKNYISLFNKKIKQYEMLQSFILIELSMFVFIWNDYFKKFIVDDSINKRINQYLKFLSFI